MKRLDTVMIAILLTGSVASCGTVARPNVRPQTPGQFDPCQDHFLLCRDQCAPREVKEASCYQHHNGQVDKVCECEETINPDSVTPAFSAQTELPVPLE